MKNGFSNTTVSNPKPMTNIATISGNQATFFRSIKLATNAIAVSTTKIAVAVMKFILSDKIENTTIGPNSILRLRSAFLNIKVSIAFLPLPFNNTHNLWKLRDLKMSILALVDNNLRLG